MGSKPKSDKRFKKVKSVGKVNSGRNLNSGSRKVSFTTLRNFTGCETCEILQVAKFSQPCKIPAMLHFFTFCSSFPMGSDLQR